MNIFRKDKDFVEDCDEMKEMVSLQKILAFAKKTKVRLGEQGYLMDRYLSLIFEAINNTLAYESASDGFGTGASLWNLCRILLDGDNLETERPFYEQAKKRISDNPILLKEKLTKINVNFTCLADDYLTIALQEFIEHQVAKIQSALDSIYLNELYGRISHTWTSVYSSFDKNRHIRTVGYYTHSSCLMLLFCLEIPNWNIILYLLLSFCLL